MNPAAGAGAVSAIHDAVTLANWIATLKSKSLPEVETIFKEYYTERYPVAKAAFKTSQQFSKLMTKVKKKLCFVVHIFSSFIPETLNQTLTSAHCSIVVACGFGHQGNLQACSSLAMASSDRQYVNHQAASVVPAIGEGPWICATTAAT